jgi:hypothetical protein
MGKQAMEIGWDEAALVARVAGDAAGEHLVAALDDGRIWACHLVSERRVTLRAETGPPVCALAVIGAARVAWGDEAGGGGILDLAGV